MTKRWQFDPKRKKVYKKMENNHRILIPEDVLVHLLNLLKQANAVLEPYVTSLTPEERISLAKMDEKTLSFVEKAHEFAKQNPNFVPPYLNMADFEVYRSNFRLFLRQCIQ